jgi:hypothetical protein
MLDVHQNTAAVTTTTSLIVGKAEEGGTGQHGEPVGSPEKPSILNGEVSLTDSDSGRCHFKG